MKAPRKGRRLKVTAGGLVSADTNVEVVQAVAEEKAADLEQVTSGGDVFSEKERELIGDLISASVTKATRNNDEEKETEGEEQPNDQVQSDLAQSGNAQHDNITTLHGLFENQQAWDQFYNRIKGKIFRSMGPLWAQFADDIFQIIVLRILSSMQQGRMQHNFSNDPKRLEKYIIGSVFNVLVDFIRKKMGGQLIKQEPGEQTMTVRKQVRPMNPRRIENFYGEHDEVSTYRQGYRENVFDMFQAHKPLHQAAQTEARMMAKELLELLRSTPEILCRGKLTANKIQEAERTLAMIKDHMLGKQHVEIAAWAFPEKNLAAGADAVRKRIDRAFKYLTKYLAENDPNLEIGNLVA